MRNPWRAGDDEAEFLDDSLAEIDDPPSRDPMNGRIRPLSVKRGSVRVVERGGCPEALRSIRPARQRALNLSLIAKDMKDMKRHSSGRRLRACDAFVIAASGQKPPSLIVLYGSAARLSRIECRKRELTKIASPKRAWPLDPCGPLKRS